MKNNKFLDERFGANDANLTPEEKMMQRFASQKFKMYFSCLWYCDEVLFSSSSAHVNN